MVMDYYKNGDLRKYLSATPFPLTVCRRILISLLLAIGHLKDQGIVHRDIKPENVLVTENYSLRLIDLGIAIHEDEQCDTTVVGTKPFIAP